MRAGSTRRILGGFAAQLAGTLGLAIERFGLAALFIAAFGVAGYESWLETVAWCGLLSVFSFGLNSWCGNRVQEAWAAGDRDAVKRQARLSLSAALAATALAAAAALGAAAIGAGPAAAPDGAAASVVDSRGVALWLVAVVCFKTAEAFLTGALRGCGRMSLGLWLAVAGQFVMLAVSAALVMLGAGLSGVAAGQAAAGLLTVLALLAALRRTADLPPAPLRPVWPRRAELRDLATRGAPYAVVNLASVAGAHLIVLAVAATAGVAGFVLARTIANFCRQIVQQFAYAVVDETARGLAGPDPEPARRLFRAAVRWSCAAAGLVAGWLVWLGGPLIAALTQGAVTVDLALLWVLAAALPATAPGLLLGALCLFSNRGRALAAAQGAFIIGLAAVLPSAVANGAVGVAAALAAAELIASVGILGRLADPDGALGFFPAAAAGLAAGAAALALGWGAGAGLAQLLALDGVAALVVFSAAWAGVCLPVAAAALLTAAERRWLAAKCAMVVFRKRSGDV